MNKPRKRRFSRWLAEMVAAAVGGPIVVLMIEIWLPVLKKEHFAIAGAVGGVLLVPFVLRWINRRMRLGSGHSMSRSQLVSEAAGASLLLSPAVALTLALTGDRVTLSFCFGALSASIAILGLIRWMNRRDSPPSARSSGPIPDDHAD